MSMIEKQIKQLRELEKEYRKSLGVHEIIDVLHEAADTIEALSAKLASANMERSERYHKIKWILMMLRAGQKEAHEKADLLEKGDNMKSFFNGKEQGICKAIDLIENDAQWKIEKRDYGGGWIAASEKMPEEKKSVLCTAYDNIFLDRRFECWIDYAIDGKWKVHECLLGEKIAWIPLPEPYKPDGEVEE